jgi:hypothetical protein
MERYPLIHQPKQPMSQPQILTPAIGEGYFARMPERGYGHVILRLEPNSENDGCYMLWSVTLEFTLNHNPKDDLLTTHFLNDVYRGLCEAITEDEERDKKVLPGSPMCPFPTKTQMSELLVGLSM